MLRDRRTVFRREVLFFSRIAFRFALANEPSKCTTDNGKTAVNGALYVVS
jgi:hypothetical protein